MTTLDGASVRAARPRRRRLIPRNSGAVTAVGIVALASMIPFAYLLVVSLTPQTEGGAPGALWVQLFSKVSVLANMGNSAILAIGATLLVIVLSSSAGFAFSKLPYRGSRLGYGLVVAALSVPLSTTILPNYLNLAQVGGINVYWAPIIMYTVGGLPFATILMTNYFASIPDEVIESSVLDGAGYGRIFVLVVSPMAAPAIATVGVLTFLGAWNDLLIGLLFLPDPALRTISVGVSALQSVRVSNLDLALTGSLLSAIPPLVAFVLFQRFLISGITAGAVR